MAPKNTTKHGNDRLENALKKIADLRWKGQAGSALATYDIGAEFAAIQEDHEEFGFADVKEAQRLVTRRTGVGKSVLYDASRVAVAWDRETIKKLVDRKPSRGKGVTFAHLVAVLGAAKKDRAELLERAFVDGLSSRALKKLVEGEEITEADPVTNFFKLMRAEVDRTRESIEAFTKRFIHLETQIQERSNQELLMDLDRIAEAEVEAAHARVSFAKRLRGVLDQDLMQDRATSQPGEAHGGTEMRAAGEA